MLKKYVVRLTDQERDELQAVGKKLKGSGQKVRRAQILLKADADGPNWTDQRIADAVGCRTKTVENVRQRLVERGFEETLNGARRPSPNCWTATRKSGSSRCGWGRLPRATPTGRSDCWLARSSSWRSWKRSVTKPCDGR